MSKQMVNGTHSRSLTLQFCVLFESDQFSSPDFEQCIECKPCDTTRADSG